MLSATYALVALSVEQANARMSLSLFQKYIETELKDKQDMDQAALDYLAARTSRLHQRCHARKLDLFLMQEMRTSAMASQPLLSELAALNLLGLAIMKTVAGILRTGIQLNRLAVNEIQAALLLYCHTQWHKLEKEEQELFVLARGGLSSQAWFSLAKKFLAHENGRTDRRKALRPSATGRMAEAQPSMQLHHAPASDKLHAALPEDWPQNTKRFSHLHARADPVPARHAVI